MIRLVTLALVSATFAATAHAQSCLSTLFNSNNGGSVGGAVYFDVTVTAANGILVTDLELNLNDSPGVGTAFTVDVYTTPGGASGNENNMAAWTMVSSGGGTIATTETPSAADVTDFTVAAGTYGMALVLTGAAHRYTNGDGSNQSYSDASLQLDLGSATNVPFTGGIFQPRVWNGTICYDQPAECFLLIGLEQLNLTIGDDTFLVDPMQILPMELGNTPVIPIPQNQGLIGLPIYVQTALYNPEIYPADPIKVSRGLQFTVGVSTDHYGPLNQLVMWPAGSIIAQPGGAIEIGFAIP